MTGAGSTLVGHAVLTAPTGSEPGLLRVAPDWADDLLSVDKLREGIEGMPPDLVERTRALMKARGDAVFHVYVTPNTPGENTVELFLCDCPQSPIGHSRAIILSGKNRKGG